MTAQQRNLAEILAALVVLIGGYLGWRGHERSLGALQVVLHASDSTAKAGVAMAAKATGVAQDAVKAAQAQHTKALAQLAASEALRARTDSIAKEASDARRAALLILRDSGATRDSLRAELQRLAERSAQDSASVGLQRSADQRTISSLLGLVHADSVALAAEQAKSRAFQTVNQALSKEIALVKKQQPSFVTQHLGAGVGYGCGQKGCEPVAAVIVRVFP